MRRLLISLLALASAAAGAQAPIRANAPAAITTDSAPDKAFPPTMDTFQLPSSGALLNALVYVAAGPGPHPAVVLLHGFPGNEKNLDLAQSLRRAGYDVFYFDYRGSWGSPGTFSFEHCQQDTVAALAYLRDPANARRLRSDPASIFLMGHSMGGFMAAYVAAHDAPAIAGTAAPLRGVVLISAADMVAEVPNLKPEQMEGAVKPTAAALEREGIAPLNAKSEDLARELIQHQADWDFVGYGKQLAKTPMLLITSDDGLAQPVTSLAAQLFQNGNKRVTSLHIATDHSYSGTRIALETSVLNWLTTVK